MDKGNSKMNSLRLILKDEYLSSCPDSETCCQLESGDYGCCPLRMFLSFFSLLV